MFFRERTPEATGAWKGRKVSHMTTDALALFMTFKGLVSGREVEAKVAEPEFRPFRFPKEEATTLSRAIAPANLAREPRTLEELGVPGPLARELELTLRGMGMAKGDRVPGYTFTKPDGTRYTLRLAPEPARDAADLAA